MNREASDTWLNYKNTLGIASDLMPRKPFLMNVAV
jgi:hypothetical protein